ncbi:MAG: hypothetical protein C5B50_23630 [Verrucomicrobia bacterium]|nr:MAG: hypothetical protein C5B50_23630 [Verrucomicrobiota bacterium]
MLSPRNQLFIALGAIVSLVIVICVLPSIGKAWWPPRQSFSALKLAVQRRDRETVASYVDAQALAESFRRCAVESMKREMAKQKADEFTDRVATTLTEQAAIALADATYTSDSVISMLCGQDPKDAMKRGVENYIVKGVDTVTKDGSERAQVYTPIRKFLDGWARPDDFDYPGEYESADRYLITMKPRRTNDLAFGLVFIQAGTTTWKFSELRVLPQSP